MLQRLLVDLNADRLAHPYDLERRAVVAYRKLTGSKCHAASYHEIGDRVLVVVRFAGAAVRAYLLRRDGRLRSMVNWPDSIW